MVAAYYRHQFKQGSNYAVDLDLRDTSGPIDTTNWTGASAIKTLDNAPPYDSANQPIAFTVTFPTSGTIRFELPADKTAQLPPRRYLYDARLFDALGHSAYYLDGDVIVDRSYTP